MDPEIVSIEQTNLLGKWRQMTLEADETVSLWQSFMPKRPTIPNRTDEFLYNVTIYEGGMNPDTFTASTPFVKWAAVKVAEDDTIIEGVEPLTLAGGLYAKFIHQGPAYEFPRTLRYIYEEWLPESPYLLDDRAHFERLTLDYRPDDQDATEEVYIPIVKKQG
ncbi:AraC family transcriptional regulator [Pontibacillus halophilus JSM 076056 = DSM 19796]|uniref:AraC family transcriptional regulator n=1 Tax=Pontibacillus halophilus JSM 076056 = DSM 19796 TaxID=1385510 RepID=A0A0A5GJP8_9BACI|nr:GyrI-like domain-containing protein [Pontibacillus halophilus]KGX91380.1 AraC family transcriptional regulator [Pontibacillus halophilus JSM 076056 = DSM 19796]